MFIFKKYNLELFILKMYDNKGKVHRQWGFCPILFMDYEQSYYQEVLLMLLEKQGDLFF